MTDAAVRNPVAVVTGSSRGIGRSIALRLAQEGWRLVLHARASSRELATLQREIASLGSQARLLQADFGDADVNWRELVAEAFAGWNQVDAWINNAGADVLTGDSSQWSLEQKLDLLWRVDVRATMMLSMTVCDRWKQASEDRADAPRLINVGWDQASWGMAGESGVLFSATKGAIMALTRSLAQTYAPTVRVNAVAPGWISTQWGHQASGYWQQRAASESLMGRWGTPEDVADVVAFLVSDAARFVAGQVIPVNGGFRFSQPPPDSQEGASE